MDRPVTGTSEDWVQDGSLPVILIDADTIPEAYHRACIACWKEGIRVETPKHLPVYPLGYDAAILIRVRFPLAEPRFHRFGLCDTFEGLEAYRLEVIYGIHDHWVVPVNQVKDPGMARWDYSYHERFTHEQQEQMMIDKIKSLLSKGDDVEEEVWSRLSVEYLDSQYR